MTKILPRRIHGFLWDLDGVLTDTSKLHHQAWIQALSIYAKDCPIATHEDFEKYFNGVPRLVGIKRFLQSRGLTAGDSSENTISEAAHKISITKNRLFRELITETSIDLFPDATSLLKRLHKIGYRNGLASQSQNADHVVNKTQLDLYLDSMATGITVLNCNVPNKPDPKFYVHAASLLGIHINDCIVFEDTYAGAFSAVSAGALMCVGVAREIGKSTELLSAGCDIIVRDLYQVDALLDIMLV